MMHSGEAIQHLTKTLGKFFSIILCTLILCTSVNANPILDRAQGAKLVYLDFWASWCGPCKASFPWMNQIQQDFADQGLKIIAVNLDNKRERADQFLKQHPAEFTILFDPEARLAKKYKVQAMPSSFILDAEGKILYEHLGFKYHEAGELRAKIEGFLSKANATNLNTIN